MPARLGLTEETELVVEGGYYLFDFGPLGLLCEDLVVEKEFLEFVFH